MGFEHFQTCVYASTIEWKINNTPKLIRSKGTTSEGFLQKKTSLRVNGAIYSACLPFQRGLGTRSSLKDKKESMKITNQNQIKFISKSAIIQCFWLHTIHRNMTVWVHKMPLQERGCLRKCTTSGNPDRPYGLLGVTTGCTHANQTKVKREDPKQSALWLRLIWVPTTRI